MTNKRTLSFLLALAIAAPQAAAFAADPATPATTTPEVTVVGKRIIGDDTYFEISLEVNGNYEDYGSIDVTLEYDPEYIVPADSWDDEAGAADMTECTSWETRRALPTLGKDTWKTHTATTYIEQKEIEDPSDATQTIKVQGKGYLYLGAEYNAKYKNTAADPAATADPTATATPEPAATAEPTPAPTVDPENKYANPVVAVRFMYTGADKKAKKADLIKVWTEKSGTQTQTYNEDWYQGSYANANPILRIAPDDICLKQYSPSKYGFTYKDADFTRRAFMYSFPAAAAAVTATGEPRATFAPGSSIATANRLTDTDIEIVTDEGKSAKSGGLTLNDVFAIIFLDWDNSILGAITAAEGTKDMPQAISNYVKEKFIHPDLQDKTDFDSKERKDNYRGEYPCENPTTGATFPDSLPAVAADPEHPEQVRGSAYPLTNKLDYVFAGQYLDTTAPYANGWVQVLTKDVDYSDRPANWQKILPKNMDDTYTWWTIGYDETIGRAPKLEADGTIAAVDDEGNTITPTPTIPDVVLYDFNNLSKEDTANSDGNLYVKAAYEKGTDHNKGDDQYYAIFGPPKVGTIGEAGTVTTFSIEFDYKRINTAGYGVSRIREAAVNFAVTETGASASTPIKLTVDNGDTIHVQLIPTNAVDHVGYQLRETYGANVVQGANKSLSDELGVFPIPGADGLQFHYYSDPILTDAMAYQKKTKTPTETYWLNKTNLANLKLSRTTTGTAYNSNTYYKKAQTAVLALMDEIDGKYDPTSITWYQLQYAVLQTKAPYYVDNNTAKTYCEKYPKLIAKLES